ncbi:hypothetical protein, partial [Pseudomonas syringae]|uniref:hypothetical protein n=1 Tax=Pseudomonas syringae TaxID=317 RepID=UPI001FF7616A
RNAKQGRQVEKNRLGNEDGANGLIVQRLPKRSKSQGNIEKATYVVKAWAALDARPCLVRKVA